MVVGEIETMLLLFWSWFHQFLTGTWTPSRPPDCQLLQLPPTPNWLRAQNSMVLRRNFVFAIIFPLMTDNASPD
ncbi:hypothetical protein ACRALDRAFT_208062 [Sodiomyces alcalophilus JCM 7366]|uniref:uncharacterized protein n=1 Tax=Sodiomyces alcalophilus JCM 7366 TaxID=591952 RepID=UPI0039B6B41C